MRRAHIAELGFIPSRLGGAQRGLQQRALPPDLTVNVMVIRDVGGQVEEAPSLESSACTPVAARSGELREVRREQTSSPPRGPATSSKHHVFHSAIRQRRLRGTKWDSQSTTKKGQSESPLLAPRPTASTRCQRHSGGAGRARPRRAQCGGSAPRRPWLRHGLAAAYQEAYNKGHRDHAALHPLLRPSRVRPGKGTPYPGCTQQGRGSVHTAASSPAARCGPLAAAARPCPAMDILIEAAPLRCNLNPPSSSLGGGARTPRAQPPLPQLP